MSLKIYGKTPSGPRLQRILRSPNYKNGTFQNLSFTAMMAEDSSMLKTMKDFFNKPKDATPGKAIPHIKTDLNQLSSTEPTVVWFGHSSYLLRINGRNILVDPVFSGNAAPVSFMVKAFDGANAYTAADMPQIDLLLLTHDHYDHLDYRTVMELQPKVKQIYCSLGVGSHLEYWGIAAQKITELDWWESQSFSAGIRITATPGRHFTGRGLQRAKTLWSSFVVQSETHKIFVGGDSGYDTHFKNIGNEFGPFDLALLECGQYNTSWPNIHMMPEQTAQAAVDLQAKALMPVHWAKFALAFHRWNEPIERVLAQAEKLNLNVTTPLIGEPVLIGKHYPKSTWWNL